VHIYADNMCVSHAETGGLRWRLIRGLDLGLALSLKYRLRQEWHVFMVLIILMTTLFFCHSLVRLGIDLTTTERSRNGSIDFSRVPSIAGSGGYANPRTPIRINTQSPQFNEGMKEPPPVYGLWRCSYVILLLLIDTQTDGAHQCSCQSRRILLGSPT
jgi:hypothetical protein